MSLSSLPLFYDLNFRTALLIGFAMSFSSTVFAIKILDQLGATGATHGRIAIGVLVVQDVAAVLFLAFTTNKVPSLWAAALFLLLPLRPLLLALLAKTGHGELLVLFGIALALGGADVFELVGMKGDVGALVLGMLLANHPKSNELAKALLGFKDLFLVGFFLSIGMTVLPSRDELLAASVFIAFLPVKEGLCFLFFSAFYLRNSTSWRTSLNLANYSAFGLIVGALAATAGWLPKDWLAVFAIALSLSFILSAPLINVRDRLYNRWRPKLKFFQRSRRLSGEEDIYLGHIRVAVFGMGRMGSAAFTAIEKDLGAGLVGVEIEPQKAEKHRQAGRNVISCDATNPDFWTRAPGLSDITSQV